MIDATLETSAANSGGGTLRAFTGVNVDSLYRLFEPDQFMERRKIELTQQSEDGFTFTSSAVLSAPPGALSVQMRAEVSGEGLLFDDAGALVSGTITGLTLFDPSGTKLATLSGIDLDFQGWSGFSTDLKDATTKFLGSAGDDIYRGGSGDDDMVGGTGNDVLEGGAGNDVIKGGRGDDTIVGGDGDDRLLGGAGDDEISLGSGQDRAFGGAGNDTFVVTAADDKDLVNGGNGFDTIDFSGLEGSGKLVVDMAKGTACLDGGASFLDFTSIEAVRGASNLENHITGSNRADTIIGGAQDDFLSGGRGNDILEGGLGDDTLAGGAGKDTFVYRFNFGADRIDDFGVGDTIDFSGHFQVNSMKDLKITATDGGTLVSTDYGSILLADVDKSTVTADSFLF